VPRRARNELPNVARSAGSVIIVDTPETSMMQKKNTLTVT
jgi:hypothetical protein